MLINLLLRGVPCELKRELPVRRQGELHLANPQTGTNFINNLYYLLERFSQYRIYIAPNEFHLNI